MRIPRFEAETGTDLRALLVECAPIVAIFTVYSRMVPKGFRLPIETFEGPSIILGGLTQPDFVVFVLLPILLLLPFWKRLRWQELAGQEHGVRAFVVAVCLASAFTFTTYDYNLFLDRAHIFDRLALLALAVAAIRHPIFATLYGAFGMLVVMQFEYPLELFNWLDKRILFVVLHLFVAFLAMAVIRKQRTVIFVGLAGSILAANYVFPGLAKIRTEWVLQDNLANLAVMTHLNGWFGRVDTGRFLELVDTLGWMNVPLLWLTLVVELGMLLLFLNRRWFILMILGSLALHAGIFLSSGICFWKWVLFNIGVLWLALKTPDQRLLFGRGFLVVSVLTILSAPFNARPTWLVWYDAPADEFTEFEVTGVSGKRYHVERGFFEPHDIVFSQNRFYFMNPEPTLLGTFGATSDAALDRALSAAPNPAAADSIIAAGASVRYDAEDLAEFSRYLRLFFATLNERGSKELWISRLRAPHHIWSQRPDPVYAGQEPVRELEIVYHRVFYDSRQVHELERRVLHRLPIPMTRAEVLASGPAPGSR